MAKFDHFNFIGPIYDLVFGQTEDHRIVELAEIEEHHRLLDVGGGTGRVTVLFKQFSNHLVIADAARQMLLKAQEKNLPCTSSQSEYLPFPDESFDRIIMVDALHHVKDHQRTLDEMWRVLKKGGRMIIEEPDIRNFVVKLIAFGEKLLLMRSHFLQPDEIIEMSSYNENADPALFVENGIARIIINKVK